MVIGYHVILSCYGFWLPNDPRGSWSDFVGKWELYKFGGAATKTDSRKSVAGVSRDATARLKAKTLLKYPPLRLTGKQAIAVAHGFDAAVRESGMAIFSCAILPEHVHLVIGKHEYPVERVAAELKARANKRMRSECGWPVGRPMWANGFWKVFLNNPEGMIRAIKYVNANPIKEGNKLQHWDFVTAYNV